MGYLSGDCLMAAAFMSYMGPFLSNYRDELVQKKWIEEVLCENCKQWIQDLDELIGGHFCRQLSKFDLNFCVKCLLMIIVFIWRLQFDALNFEAGLTWFCLFYLSLLVLYFAFYNDRIVVIDRFVSWEFPVHQTSISVSSWPSRPRSGTGTSRGCLAMPSPRRMESSWPHLIGGPWWWTLKVRPSSGSRTWRPHE